MSKEKMPMGSLSTHYATRLLREARKDPESLRSRRAFLNPDFFQLYARSAEKLIWHKREGALPFVAPAPEYGARMADAFRQSDYLLLGHSLYGHGLRRCGKYREAERQFSTAESFAGASSSVAVARHCRYFALHCVYQRQGRAFTLIEKAIHVYRQGNLVDRHGFGQCLIIRGIAHQVFGSPEQAISDFTAALNHLRLSDEDDNSYYCALHNLVFILIVHGEENELQEARANLTAARAVLQASVRRHVYAKYVLRWLFALLDFRLEHHHAAIEKMLTVTRFFEEKQLPFDLGCAQLDLARMYLKVGARDEVKALAVQTSKVFGGLDTVKAGEAADLWREVFYNRKVTDSGLVEARNRFFEKKPQMLAAA